MTKYQRKKLNALLHELIVLRDGERCLRCGKVGVLHMSHIYPKGAYRGMQYDPENLKFLCVRHHLFWWHRDPIGAKEWLIKAISRERLARLKKKSNSIIKPNYEKIKKDLEEEIQRLKMEKEV